MTAANPGADAPFDLENQQRFPFRPVIWVNHHGASDYCRWWSGQTGRVVRLPTDAEWSAASSGDGKREFPWGGQEPGEDLANFGMRTGRRTPVGLLPAGSTPEGVSDLAGNAWEWTGSYYDERQETFSLRGGAFDFDAGFLCSVGRDHSGPGDRYVSMGSVVSGSDSLDSLFLIAAQPQETF